MRNGILFALNGNEGRDPPDHGRVDLRGLRPFPLRVRLPYRKRSAWSLIYAPKDVRVMTSTWSHSVAASTQPFQGCSRSSSLRGTTYTSNTDSQRVPSAGKDDALRCPASHRELHGCRSCRAVLLIRADGNACKHLTVDAPNILSRESRWFESTHAYFLVVPGTVTRHRNKTLVLDPSV